jgi:hypothetical protein
MREGTNSLVPLDELHWDPMTKSYRILSTDEVDDLIKACMAAGMEDTKSIVKVIKEYERVRSGKLLFDQFLAGRIGICDFDKNGSPVFDSSRPAAETSVRFVCDRYGCDCDSAEFNGWHVSCPDGNHLEMFSDIARFCSKWGVDLFGGENPEVLGAINDDPEFQREFSRRPWRAVHVESSAGRTNVDVVVRGL